VATGIRRWIGRRRRGQTALVPTARPLKREPDGQAIYVGTTVGGSQHHRIVGGALFGRGECRYWIEPGSVVFERIGAGGGVTVALTEILQVGQSGAHAGQVLAPSRIAIVTWALGAEELDTGFGFSDAKHAEAFAERVAAAAGLSPEKGPHAGA
jgi:hypothetical protein